MTEQKDIAPFSDDERTMLIWMLYDYWWTGTTQLGSMEEGVRFRRAVKGVATKLGLWDQIRERIKREGEARVEGVEDGSFTPFYGPPVWDESWLEEEHD